MLRKQMMQSYDGNKIDLDIMIHIDTDCVRGCYDSMSCVDFIKYVTDQYLEAVGGSLTAENMEMLSADQHSLLCYRYMLDEVMEGASSNWWPMALLLMCFMAHSLTSLRKNGK